MRQTPGASFAQYLHPLLPLLGGGGGQFAWCSPLTTPFSDYILRKNGCRVSYESEVIVKEARGTEENHENN
jgi:hypothetical protein